MSAVPAFSRRAALALVAAGAISFLVLLYAVSRGLGGEGNNGGPHALSNGLTGYSALAGLLEKRGISVVRSRDPARLDDPGLLVLTPPQEADGDALKTAIDARRRIGPTLLVLPKWIAVPADGPQAKPGWVRTVASQPPGWLGDIDERITAEAATVSRWRGGERSGVLAAYSDAQVAAAKDDALVPLVTDQDSRLLAGYLNDDGSYPALDTWSGWDAPAEPDRELFPLAIVAEPDLLDNRGLADRAVAGNALALVRALRQDPAAPVVFDVTFNGLGRSRNLLTLAFTPPFLAATLALILAAFAAAWRGFGRFGPPRLASRPIAFGKAALVENSAGLIRRTGRIRLLGAPYAALVTQRALRTLGLPASASLAAIDAAQSRRGIPGQPFSQLVHTLRGARKPQELVRAAAALNSIDKALHR